MVVLLLINKKNRRCGAHQNSTGGEGFLLTEKNQAAPGRVHSQQQQEQRDDGDDDGVAKQKG